MTLTKSDAVTVRTIDGNQLTIFINQSDGLLYMKDVQGRIALLSDYITANGNFLENVGNGIQIFTDNAGLPAQLRSLVAGNNIDITEVGDEIHIAVTGLPTIGNVGTGAEIYKSGTDTPFELRSIKQGSNVVITQTDDEIEIAVPSVVGTTLYYGSFYSTQTQTTVCNEQKAMTFNNTDATATSGFSIVSNSQITAAHTGVYNIAFSAQLYKTMGGGATQIYIWIKKNGVDLPDSNTTLTLANNGDLLVAAWNLFLQLNAGQYVELYWYATAASIRLLYNTTPEGLPAIPSVIATINRVG
jgi:hypothetical protein